MKKTSEKGFALLISIITTSILLLVSFVVADIAYKQLILTYSGRESQTAFYAADSGVECATYWDVKSGPVSPFATSTPGSITCNNQNFSTGSPSGTVIGGGGAGNPTSVFQISFTKGCAVVQVTKSPDGSTVISSRGYNTCSVSALRRYERGITISY